MRLLTWNVQWFRGLDGAVDVKRVIAHARALIDFDLLCLQEVSDNYPDLPGCDGANQALAVADALPEFAVHFAAAVDEVASDGRSRRRFGNLIASRYPLAWVREHALPWPHDAQTAQHPSMPRVALEALVLAPTGPLRVLTTHLEYYNASQRLAQAQAIARIVQEGAAAARYPPAADEPGSPFAAKPHSPHAIVCGDMNDAPGSATWHALRAAGLRDAWSIAHPGQAAPPTFRLHERTLEESPIACDWIFVSETLAPHVLAVKTDSETTLSDHQPVWIELNLG
ncbi:MAG: endonuclease/exonuclease/phosphatase family protein [Burkholderiales bacterium]|nr:endonuclease/exonuclease/phosphatase family protein [Burkholderiales bacterium]